MPNTLTQPQFFLIARNNSATQTEELMDHLDVEVVPLDSLRPGVNLSALKVMSSPRTNNTSNTERSQGIDAESGEDAQYTFTPQEMLEGTNSFPTTHPLFGFPVVVTFQVLTLQRPLKPRTLLQ